MHLSSALPRSLSFSVNNPNIIRLSLKNSNQRSCSRGGRSTRPPTTEGRRRGLHAASREADIMNVLEDEMSHRSGDVPCALEQRGGTLSWKIAFCKREWGGGSGRRPWGRWPYSVPSAAANEGKRVWTHFPSWVPGSPQQTTPCEPSDWTQSLQPGSLRLAA